MSPKTFYRWWRKGEDGEWRNTNIGESDYESAKWWIESFHDPSEWKLIRETTTFEEVKST